MKVNQVAGPSKTYAESAAHFYGGSNVGLKHPLWMIIGAPILLAGSSCMVQSKKNDASLSAKLQEKNMESIGSASQEDDGTIVLMLRAETADGTMGDAQFRYPPPDPDYAMIESHVGPIPKNGSVRVKPFPDRKSGKDLVDTP